MTVPSAYAVSIYVQSVDVTAYVSFDTIEIDDLVHDVSKCSFVVENPSGVTPARLQQVEIVTTTFGGGITIFYGIIVELETKKRDNGITVEYHITCADQKYRLEKATIPPNFYDDTSVADLLSSLLGDAYPDLTGLFDFSTNVDSLFDSLDFRTDDTTLLDALRELAELTGENFRFDTPTNGGYLVPSYTQLVNDVVAGIYDLDNVNGNPQTCWRIAFNTGSYFTPLMDLLLLENLNHTVVVNNVTYDYYITEPATEMQIGLSWKQINEAVGSSTTTSITRGAWTTVDWKVDVADVFPLTLDTTDTRLVVYLEHTVPGAPTSGDYDWRIDNVLIETDEGNYLLTFDSDGSLQWTTGLPAAAFDIDVQNSDEWASDINLFEGDFDDYNSVTVIGGNTRVAIDWVYPMDGSSERLDLETVIEDMAVYTNGASDTSPNWSFPLPVEEWGVGDFTGNGGTASILHDPKNNWLFFEAFPPNLTNAVRITGYILQPLRVRVEAVGDGDPTLSVTVYDDDVHSTEEAVARANAELNKRGGVRRLEFVTSHPGLQVGTAMTVTDSARGLSEELMIQRIHTKWLGSSGHAVFSVECGDEDSDADRLIANNDKRSRDKSGDKSAVTLTVAPLTDSDNLTLTDADGAVLYTE